MMKGEDYTAREVFNNIGDQLLSHFVSLFPKNKTIKRRYIQ
ncbi:hypothetical protein LCGC14_1644090 [marine sediment metagenome]|uniref:Uncharacterized protein n=1 Tax=marine sediment metagenome TaxID=412755 RepID=A0A0F9KYL4_9ZZZZ